MNPVFSIITVTLNCAEDARATAASVAAQRGVTLEHIVKDGGSIDGTLSTINIANPNANIISCSDTGIYHAMNQAIKHATGEYVLFLNAGDVLLNADVLASVSRTIHNNDRPDLIYCDYTTPPSGQLITSPSSLGSFTLFRSTICHQVCFFRRDCYERFGDFDTDLRIVADYDFLLRCVHDARCSNMHVGIPVVFYKAGGFSDNNWSKAVEEVRHVRKRHYGWLTRHVYLCIISITMPGLRRRIARSGIAGRAYYRLINFINRHHPNCFLS